MIHELILYRRNDCAFGIKEWRRALLLQTQGHPVHEIKTRTYHSIRIDKMWMDFETEEEAAIFKLTYL